MDALCQAVAAESEVPGLSIKAEAPCGVPNADVPRTEDPVEAVLVAPAPAASRDAPLHAAPLSVDAPCVEALHTSRACVEPAAAELQDAATAPPEVVVPKGPVPQFPRSQAVYTLDADNKHIIRIDISATGKLEGADRKYVLARLAEPWVTVIVKGATQNLTTHLWNFEYIRTRCATLMYHKYRVFRRAEGPTAAQPSWEEKEWTSMTIGDYGRYLDARKQALTADPLLSGASRSIQVTNHEGELVTFDTIDTVIYLLDFSLAYYLPEVNFDLSKYALDLVRTGGEFCALRYVSEYSRPAMGPNLYITPPGAFTWFHEDGHGTVDSAHQSFKGYNEVVMLKRMEEEEKKKALRILRGDTMFGRRDLPHDDTRIPGWPTSDQLKQLAEMNAMPATFTLQPGEFVHINKGRLHAFRKAAEKVDDVCVSVAWDWVFTGTTARAVEQEMMTALKCAAENMLAKVGSLGITELCLMNMAKAAVGQYRVTHRNEALDS